MVIGDQSSGKSSTLESLSGIELPKGTGTVTRAPLEIQLRQTSLKKEQGIEIWVNPNSDEGSLPPGICNFLSSFFVTCMQIKKKSL